MVFNQHYMFLMNSLSYWSINIINMSPEVDTSNLRTVVVSDQTKIPGSDQLCIVVPVSMLQAPS